MKQVVIIGGGPAGLMAASILAEAGIAVSLYDSMPSVGRKFLVAGHGGLNLTNAIPLDAFSAKYGAHAEFFKRLLTSFSPDNVRNWAARLGITTFIGTSGRVFPTDLKAAPLLKAWTDDLENRGVTFHARRRWIGWDGRDVLFEGEGKRISVTADAVVLALGGASWPQTGSDGAWTSILEKSGIRIAPMRPANCGFDVAWSETFIARCDGKPLKNVVLSADGVTSRGDVMLTKYGLEGGAVYELSAHVRLAIERHGKAQLCIDLKPDLSLEDVVKRLMKPRDKRTLSNHLRRTLNLPPAAFGLLRESATAEELANVERLGARIKACAITLTAARPIAEAISSAGGIDLAELDENLMLQKLPGIFAAGEMLGWEAPTGGFLLQGCLSTGAVAARGVLTWAKEG